MNTTERIDLLLKRRKITKDNQQVLRQLRSQYVQESIPAVESIIADPTHPLSYINDSITSRYHRKDASTYLAHALLGIHIGAVLIARGKYSDAFLQQQFVFMKEQDVEFSTMYEPRNLYMAYVMKSVEGDSLEGKIIFNMDYLIWLSTLNIEYKRLAMGSTKPMNANTLSMFAAFEEIAHFTQERRGKYPNINTQMSMLTRTESKKEEFNSPLEIDALLWKARIENLFGYDYGFNQTVATMTIK